MDLTPFIPAFVTIVVLIVLIFFIKKPVINSILKSVEDKTKTLLQEERDRISEEYKLKTEVLDGKMNQSTKELESKKDAIKEIVSRIEDELKANKDKYSTLTDAFKNYENITKDLRESTDDLKNILSNNQLRGKYGQEVAENLLQSVGFVKGQNYLVETTQDTLSTRPDLTLLLPDGTKLNIDVKFPFTALVKYQEATEKQEKDLHFRQFVKDVKEKIKQIIDRGYVNPEDKTVDFAVLFVPNEMIFSFIYEKLNDEWNDALKKKVVMAGPFSFTAILRIVYQSYKNFRYQENLQDIIKLIKVFEREYEKFNEELDTLGKRLHSVSSQYDLVSLTRTKKLQGVVEKIKNEQVLPEPHEGRKKLSSKESD